jgi:hypothetical protein
VKYRGREPGWRQRIGGCHLLTGEVPEDYHYVVGDGDGAGDVRIFGTEVRLLSLTGAGLASGFCSEHRCER